MGVEGGRVPDGEPCPAGIRLARLLSLEEAAGPGQGATAHMGRGLILRCRGESAAGEGAGFGLPVVRLGGETRFPSVVATLRAGTTAVERTYRFDRRLLWHCRGRPLPRWCTGLSELLVRAYKRRPARQSSLLRARDRALAAARLSSAMVPSPSWGECTVRCHASRGGLLVDVPAADVPRGAEVILLNEAAGTWFTRLRLGDGVLEGDAVPGWTGLEPGARFESPARGLWFGPGPQVREAAADHRLEGGREVGRGLDWAGFAVIPRRLPASYRVAFALLDAAAP